MDVLIDTGAEGAVMGMKLANELGVTFLNDTTLLNGLVAGVLGNIESLQVGSLEIRNFPIIVIIDDEIVKNKEGYYDMADQDKIKMAYERVQSLFSDKLVLGLSFLQLLDNIELDFSNNSVIINNSEYKTPDTKTPFLIVEKFFCLNGTVNGNNATLLLDTGVDHIELVLNSNYFERYKNSFLNMPIDKEPFNLMSVGNILQSQSYIIDDAPFSINNLSVPVSKTYIIDAQDIERDGKYVVSALNADGFAGMAFLSNFKKVGFDMKNAYIYIFINKTFYI